MPSSELFLRDVIDIKEDVHAGDFKIELSAGFSETDARVAEYVVTDQLRGAFEQSLRLVAAAVRTGNSHAAYLHGSFGAGKSHFLTVLHAILDNAPAARRKPRLQEVVAEHDDWLRRTKFLMVPYHLIGAADLDSALLGGYVATVRKLHPDRATPAVYRADAVLEMARTTRVGFADDAGFSRWLGGGAVAVGPGGVDAVDEDDLDTSGLDTAPAGGSGGPAGAWTTADLDRAFDAPAGDPDREALVSALLSGPMAAYATGVRGDKDAFVPLENGLSVISRHAKSLGYDGIILFLDELILWLQAHMGEQDFVRDQVQKLVKLIESGDSDRPVPIVSFISRQRDLSQLIGSDVAGAEVQNLEQQVEYLAGRIDVVDLEDSNLVEIIKHRVLAPKAGMEAAREAAFAAVESSKDEVRQILLDANGRTEATWDDFRDLYPLSPAFLNVLVELSGALQRERTGLKLVQETLRRRRDDLRLGELVPLGDLWDVILDGTGEAFTARLRKEAETAKRFHGRITAHLEAKYGSRDNPQFNADDRLVKTLLLAALAPNVPALARLTGERLAALNHGSIKVRLGSAGSVAVKRLKELQGEFGELRSEGSADPVFHLHLSDLDIEPLLDEVGSEDNAGKRRQWVKDQLWTAFGIGDAQAFVSEREIVWRGTRRTAEFVFGNVSDPHLPDAQFVPQTEGNIRLVLDYPFDEKGFPNDDVRRVEQLKQEGKYAATLVWLPHFLSEQKANQLGRLLKINYLLERDRLTDHTATRSADERIQIRHQLKAQSENLTSQLTAVLQQLYGINKPDPANVGAEVTDNLHLWSLEPAWTRPRPRAGLGFEQNLLALADDMFAALYPKHPDFDPNLTRKPITTRELKTALDWISEAMKDGSRRAVVDRHHLAVVKKIVQPLGLGEVHDGPLNLLNDWRLWINQKASEARAGKELPVEDIRRWIAELGWTGLDRSVTNLVIATYALLDDRTWTWQTTPVKAPELERIGPGYGLREAELPSEEEFATARARAATIFGISAQPAYFARNVAALESGVRGVVEAHRNAVGGVRRSLDKHGEDLGIQDRHADRVRSMRAAADLLDRLSRAKDATDLVRELAAAAYDVTDHELAGAIKQSPEVLEALDAVNWTLLRSVRGFVGHDDALGDKAERLIDTLREAASDHEQVRSLVPVLSRLQDQCVALVTEAAHLAQVSQPHSQAEAEQVGAERPAEPGDISLTEHGRPAVPSGESASSSEPGPAEGPARLDRPAAPPRTRAPHVVSTETHSGLEAHLASAIADVQDEIRTHAVEHPGVPVQIFWRPLTDGSASEGTDTHS